MRKRPADISDDRSQERKERPPANARDGCDKNLMVSLSKPVVQNVSGVCQQRDVAHQVRDAAQARFGFVEIAPALDQAQPPGFELSRIFGIPADFCAGAFENLAVLVDPRHE